jgi:hypothetical protein
LALYLNNEANVHERLILNFGMASTYISEIFGNSKIKLINAQPTSSFYGISFLMCIM